MSKILNELYELKRKINIEVDGTENYPTDEVSLIVANHTCLMDIFYLPMALPNATVSLISPRLMYKKEPTRQAMIYRYLNPMPIEAHGGKVYADICLRYATELLSKGISISIFPEGAYVEDRSVIYRGRTGASRILYDCKEQGINVNLIPVAINIENKPLNLDTYYPDDSIVRVKILKPLDYELEYNWYLESESDKERNMALHAAIDKSLSQIAVALNRPYSSDYIELFRKNNVMFPDGTAVPNLEANNEYFTSLYENKLSEYSNSLSKRFARK